MSTSNQVDDAPPLGLGIIGAGGFGTFVCSAAAGLPGVRVVALADEDAARAARLAAASGATVAADLTAMLTDDRVEAVIIATPPSTHAALAIRAFEAGRHVFSEKPMALSVEDARRVSAAAASSGRVYVVDHVIRYNPIITAVERLRDEGLVGPLQRFSFENAASHEFLQPDHWFWDPDLSGGILLEHGVHFFDVAAELIGAPAREVQTMGYRRADGRVDTVVATVAHTNGVLATHAHGFCHASRAERQLMRLDCGLTEILIHGWIPLLAEFNAWVDDQGAEAYEALPARAQQLLNVQGARLGGAELITVDVRRNAAEPATHTRDRDFQAPHHRDDHDRPGLARGAPAGLLRERAGCHQRPGNLCSHRWVTPSGGRFGRLGRPSGVCRYSRTRRWHDGPGPAVGDRSRWRGRGRLPDDQ